MRYSAPSPQLSVGSRFAARPAPTGRAASRRYRCHYHPKDLNGYPAACSTGVLPFVQVNARDAEHARRAAHQLTGCSIGNVERLDEVTA